MPIGSVSPFRPTGTASLSLSTANASANVPLAGGGDTVVVTNPSNVLAYVRFGADQTVAASTSDMPILPGSRLILSVNSLITYTAAIMPLGTGIILFSRGDGSVV
ncbi:hypothetical protein [Rhodopila sp.]|uniref:hypothetical protein n=1 Tax=Rhodopila sp. TaxID=2480087 RepID=UPI003D0BF844